MNIEKISSIVKKVYTDAPTTTATLGYELEYAVRYDEYGNPMPMLEDCPLTMLFNRHVDWGYVFEIDSPVLSSKITRREAIIGTVMEWLAYKDGFIVSDYYYDDGDSRDVERSLSRHMHFKGSAVRMAKFANWLVLLAGLLKPAYAMMRRVVTMDGDNYNIDEGGDFVVWYRNMVSHYAAVPMLIDVELVREAGKSRRRWRGYEDGDRNRFYAVELNRYRKNVLTLEFRINEQHILALWVTYDILDKLASIQVPWVSNIAAIYRNYVYIDTSIDSKIHIELIKEHEIQEYCSPKEFARWLINKFENLQWYTKKILEIIASGRRVRYNDYAELWLKIVEQKAPEVAELAEEVYKDTM